MVYLSSGPLIDEIGQSVRSALKQSLDHDQMDDSIQFAIPPKTTVFLGSSSGGNVLFFAGLSPNEFGLWGRGSTNLRRTSTFVDGLVPPSY